MKLTWYGHSAFRIETADAKILIDPYLIGNPSWTGGWEGPAEGDHPCAADPRPQRPYQRRGRSARSKSGAQLVANFEICMYLVGKGVSGDKINPGNIGGTVDCGGFTTTFVQALHSSSFGEEGGKNIYLGNPGGLVLHFPEDKTLYHMGDTDIFSDMALINELHEPKIGIVPIGDRFTMGGAVAALACRRFFKFDTVVPCHFGTFPMIDQTPDKFVAGLEGSGVKVALPKIGETIEI